MASESGRSEFIATIDLIENSRKSQKCIDEIQEKLWDIISNEVETWFHKIVYQNKNNC